MNCGTVSFWLVRYVLPALLVCVGSPALAWRPVSDAEAAAVRGHADEKAVLCACTKNYTGPCPGGYNCGPGLGGSRSPEKCYKTVSRDGLEQCGLGLTLRGCDGRGGCTNPIVTYGCIDVAYSREGEEPGHCACSPGAVEHPNSITHTNVNVCQIH